MKACFVCGRRSDQARCPEHRLGPQPRGNAFQPTRLRIAERDRWICQLCGDPIHTLADLAIDHRIPRAAGGTDDDSNLQAAHVDCNLRKGSRHADQLHPHR